MKSRTRPGSPPDSSTHPGRLRLLDPSAAEGVPGVRVLIVNCLSMWICAFTGTSISVALPPIQAELSLSAVTLGWVPLAYMLSSAVLLVPFGKIADLLGRRLVYLAGLAVFALSSLGLVFVGSYMPLILLRVGQGVGGALMFATSTAMVTLAYPPGRRGRAMGILVACVYMGQAMGPVVGGVLTFNIGWRALFLFAAVYGFAVFLLDLVLLRRAEWAESFSRFDWKGSVIYAVSLSCLLAGLSLLPQMVGITLVTLGVVGIAGFGWLETRVSVPVLDISLFRKNRTFALSNLAALASYAAINAMTLLMSLYLQLIRGLDAQMAGLVLVAGVVVQAAFSPLAGRLSDRVEARWVASAGMTLTAVGLFLLAFLSESTPYWTIFLALIVLGLGYAFFSSPNQNSIMSSVSRHDVSMASAVLGTARMIGQAMSVATATLVMAVIIGRQNLQPADYPDLLVAVRTTFIILTAICVVGIGASLARGPRPETRP